MENFQGKPTLHFRWMAIRNSTTKPHAVLSRVWVIPLSSMPTLPAMSHWVTDLVIRSSVTASLWLRSWLARERQINSAAGGAQGREESVVQLRVATVGSLRHPTSVGHWGKKPDNLEIRHGSEGPLHHVFYLWNMYYYHTLTFGQISNCSHTH